MKVGNYEYFKWTLAVLAALMWHLLLWIYLPVSEAVSKNNPRPRATRLSYIRNIDGADGASAVSGDLMTPVLFSLPSSVGFSKSISSYGIDIMSALKTDVGEVALLDKPIVKHSESLLLVWPRHMDRQVSSLLNNTVLNQPRHALEPSLEVKMLDKPHVTIEGPLANCGLPTDGHKLKVEGSKSPYWQVRIKMNFDPAGLPTGVFIVDSSGSADIDHEVLMELNRWRVDPKYAPVQGEVIIQRN